MNVSKTIPKKKPPKKQKGKKHVKKEKKKDKPLVTPEKKQKTSKRLANKVAEDGKTKRVIVQKIYILKQKTTYVLFVTACSLPRTVVILRAL